MTSIIFNIEKNERTSRNIEFYYKGNLIMNKNLIKE